MPGTTRSISVSMRKGAVLRDVSMPVMVRVVNGSSGRTCLGTTPMWTTTFGFVLGTIGYLMPPGRKPNRLNLRIAFNQGDVIHTARASEVWPPSFRRREVAKVERFLRRHGIPFDKITADKEPSEYVVDDRAIAFDHAGAWPSNADRILDGKDRGPRPEVER